MDRYEDEVKEDKSCFLGVNVKQNLSFINLLGSNDQNPLFNHFYLNSTFGRKTKETATRDLPGSVLEFVYE